MNRVDYFRIIHQHIPPDSAVYPLYVIHCQLVARKALSIAERLRLVDESMQFIEEAAMLHDIGIVRTNTPKLYCYGEHPYLMHLVAGRDILEAEGLPQHARVAATHGGVGITREHIIHNQLPLPHEDFVPTCVEEEIISYADLFFSKNPKRLWEEKPLDKVRQTVEKYGEEARQTLDLWIERFDI